MERGAGLIVRLKACVATADTLSVTRTVKVNGPAVVGVPPMTPLNVLIARPGGGGVVIAQL
jgi:hypothetical protein